VRRGGGQHITERRCCELKLNVVSLLGIRQSEMAASLCGDYQRSCDVAEMLLV